MSTITLLCIALAGVIMLLLLVIKAKVQPFVALLLVSLLVALAAGIPAGEVGKVMIAGMGGVLGSVTIIIGLGAMLGRMIEHSGGAESLANYFSRKLGDKRWDHAHCSRGGTAASRPCRRSGVTPRRHRLANHHRYCDFYSRRGCWLLCSENNQ